MTYAKPAENVAFVFEDANYTGHFFNNEICCYSSLHSLHDVVFRRWKRLEVKIFQDQVDLYFLRYFDY